MLKLSLVTHVIEVTGRTLSPSLWSKRKKGEGKAHLSKEGPANLLLGRWVLSVFREGWLVDASTVAPGNVLLLPGNVN